MIIGPKRMLRPWSHFPMARGISLAFMAWLVVVASAQAVDTDGRPMAFRVGKVVTMNGEDTVLNNAVVLVRNGKIEQFGKRGSVEIPEGYAIVDANDKWLVPGLIDCHNHTVAAGWGGDLNDMVYLTNPGLRTLETIQPENRALKNARAGGVTTVLMIPGSGTNMAGFGTISKTAGRSVDDMVVRAPGSLRKRT